MTVTLTPLAMPKSMPITVTESTTMKWNRPTTKSHLEHASVVPAEGSVLTTLPSKDGTMTKGLAGYH
nr:unnamed protein product [Haemonchus contortus]